MRPAGVTPDRQRDLIAPIKHLPSHFAHVVVHLFQLHSERGVVVFHTSTFSLKFVQERGLLAKQGFRRLRLNLRNHHLFLLFYRMLHAFSKFLDVIVNAGTILISLREGKLGYPF